MTTDSSSILTLQESFKVISSEHDGVILGDQRSAYRLHGRDADAARVTLKLIGERRSMKDIREIVSAEVGCESASRVFDILSKYQSRPNILVSGKSDFTAEYDLLVIGLGELAGALAQALARSRGVSNLRFTTLAAEGEGDSSGNFLGLGANIRPMFWAGEGSTLAESIQNLSRDVLVDTLTRYKAVLLVAESLPYQCLHALSMSCRVAGIPYFPVICHASSVTIGPTVLPGGDVCPLTALPDSLRKLGPGSPDVERFIHAGSTHSFHREIWSDLALDHIASVVSKELAGLRAGGPDLELLRSVLEVSNTGLVTRNHVTVTICPECKSLEKSEHPVLDPAMVSEFALRADIHESFLYALTRQAAVLQDETACQSIGIIGGGTAGYLTALALRQAHPGMDVTLIESSEIPVIGVGEATTPSMPRFLHERLRIPIDELFREV